MDTGGHERFRTIYPRYYVNLQGILLVYDVGDEKSFREIDFWVQEV